MVIVEDVGKVSSIELEKGVYEFVNILNWIIAPPFPFSGCTLREGLFREFKGNFIFYAKIINSEGFVVLNQTEWDELIFAWNNEDTLSCIALLASKLNLYRNIPLKSHLFKLIYSASPYLDKSNKVTSPLFVTINDNKKLFPENFIKAIFRIMYEGEQFWVRNLLGIELSGNLAWEFFKSNKNSLPSLDESIQLVQLARAYCAGSISKEKMDLISEQLVVIN